MNVFFFTFFFLLLALKLAKALHLPDLADVSVLYAQTLEQKEEIEQALKLYAAGAIHMIMETLFIVSFPSSMNSISYH